MAQKQVVTVADTRATREAFESVRQRADQSAERMAANIQNFVGITDEDRATMLLDAEYRKEQMHNMAREGLQGGFFNRRDKAAVRAIVAAMKEARK